MAAASVIYSAPGLLPGPPSPQPELTSIENKLKYIIQNRGIRVSEFFQDYDPLRSGYITSEYNILRLVACIIISRVSVSSLSGSESCTSSQR